MINLSAASSIISHIRRSVLLITDIWTLSRVLNQDIFLSSRQEKKKSPGSYGLVAIELNYVNNNPLPPVYDFRPAAEELTCKYRSFFLVSQFFRFFPNTRYHWMSVSEFRQNSFNRYRRKRPKVDATNHTRRQEASEKKKKILASTFESSPVSVKT